MRAVLLHAPGPPEHLTLTELPDLASDPPKAPGREVARAHADLEGRRALGEVVLTAGRADPAMNAVATVGPPLQTARTRRTS